jgi:hypothetical protein
MDDLARQAAGNLSTFSGAYTFTTARAAKTAAFLAAATPVHVRLALLLDVLTAIQWLVVYRQQVVVVTRPFVASDDLGQAIFLGSLGDGLAQATPVSLLNEITLGGMVVTQDNHIALGLLGCVAIPGMLDPSCLRMVPLPRNKPASIAFTSTPQVAPATLPFLACCPPFFPWPLAKPPFCKPSPPLFPQLATIRRLLVCGTRPCNTWLPTTKGFCSMTTLVSSLLQICWPFCSQPASLSLPVASPSPQWTPCPHTSGTSKQSWADRHRSRPSNRHRQHLDFLFMGFHRFCHRPTSHLDRLGGVGFCVHHPGRPCVDWPAQRAPPRFSASVHSSSTHAGSIHCPGQHP